MKVQSTDTNRTEKVSCLTMDYESWIYACIIIRKILHAWPKISFRDRDEVTLQVISFAKNRDIFAV
ncbi:hypothetical protein ACHAXS_007507, partial [Conticribra weissflogii]